jgi:hypothetical protein
LLAYKPRGFEITAADKSESIQMPIKTTPYFNLYNFPVRLSPTINSTG